MNIYLDIDGFALTAALDDLLEIFYNYSRTYA